MKKFGILIILLVVLSTAVFSDSSVNFKGGRIVLGGSSSLTLDFEDFENTIIRLNPDLGIFLVDNLLLELGANFRYQNDNSYLGLDSGVKYFFSGAVFVPSIGTTMTYSIVDDFSGNYTGMNLWMNLGLDIFLLENLSLFAEMYSYSFDISDSADTSTAGFSATMEVSFGFHFFVPVGPLEFTN